MELEWAYKIWDWNGLMGLGLGYGRMGFGILPNPLVWAASIGTTKNLNNFIRCKRMKCPSRCMIINIK